MLERFSDRLDVGLQPHSLAMKAVCAQSDSEVDGISGLKLACEVKQVTERPRFDVLDSFVAIQDCLNGTPYANVQVLRNGTSLSSCSLNLAATPASTSVRIFQRPICLPSISISENPARKMACTVEFLRLRGLSFRSSFVAEAGRGMHSGLPERNRV